jgi:hypothetical protein
MTTIIDNGPLTAVAFEWAEGGNCATVPASEVFEAADRFHGAAPTYAIKADGRKFYTHGRYDRQTWRLVRIIGGNSSQFVVATR